MKFLELLNKVLYKDDNQKVFIIGKEKSGTTAISTLLSIYSKKSLTMDMPTIWREKEKAIFEKKLSFSEYVRDNPKFFKSKIIKEPALTYFFDQVLTEFPDSKYVYISRNPLDNIKSIFSRLNIKGNISSFGDLNFDKIPKDWINVVLGKDFNIKGEDPVSVAADRWNLAIKTFIKNKNQFIHVKYEDFNKNKVPFIMDLADKIGLEEKSNIKFKINDNFQTKATVKDPKLFFSEENFNKIQTICKDMMLEVDYPVLL